MEDDGIDEKGILWKIIFGIYRKMLGKIGDLYLSTCKIFEKQFFEFQVFLGCLRKYTICNMLTWD